MKARVKALINSQYLFGQRCVTIEIHWRGSTEMTVWVEVEDIGMKMERREVEKDGIKMKRVEEEEMDRESQLEEEEHVLIAVMASVMIYQV